MIYFEKAIQLDIQRKYIPAMEMYEDSILADEGILDAYINLAFLYWSSGCQLEWSVGVIDKVIRRNGYKLAFIKLDLAKEKFDSSEIFFWELYFKRRTIGEDISENEILHILKKHAFTGYAPYFYLFLLDRVKYTKEASVLNQECINNPTVKNVEMKSIMEYSFNSL